ncbi:hypothetical protein G4B88_008083 [Cannabis sativa]|uniref:RNase H type-1 domain-containing protein n=1 Tax=Cannabis sativa TaxID=3483 RepID=A0A7J6I799_CANSA|nr:hypothetical protein G4B88_008083 [Cannabis sativa]
MNIVASSNGEIRVDKLYKWWEVFGSFELGQDMYAQNQWQFRPAQLFWYKLLSPCQTCKTPKNASLVARGIWMTRDFIKDNSSLDHRQRLQCRVLELWKIRISDFPLHSGVEVVNWILNPPLIQDNEEAFGKTKFLIYAASLYHNLWMFRNKNYHNNENWPMQNMLKKVNEDFLSHLRIYSMGLSTHSHDDGSGIQIIRWGLPRPDRIRVNVDYANIDGIGSVGVVALDGYRGVLALYVSNFSASSVLRGELEAISLGLAVIQRLRLCDVDLISDCEALVLAIKKHQSPAWNVSFSFSHVLNLLLDLGVNFVWLSQSCNHLAHVLAK